MALTRVDTGLQSFPDFNRNQQLANAQIYIGVPGLDPAVLANQYQAYVVQENGTQVAVPQPIRTSAGGIPTFNGSPVQIAVAETAYSVKVLNALGSQIYYQPNNTDLALIDAAQVSYTPAGTGAVTTTVEAILNQSVDVRNYGASTLNTPAQNTAAIQNVLDQFKYVVISEDYLVDAAIFPPSGARLYFIGGSLTASQIITGDECLIKVANASDVEIHNAKLDCASFDANSGLIIRENTTGVRVYNIQVDNAVWDPVRGGGRAVLVESNSGTVGEIIIDGVVGNDCDTLIGLNGYFGSRKNAVIVNNAIGHNIEKLIAIFGNGPTYPHTGDSQQFTISNVTGYSVAQPIRFDRAGNSIISNVYIYNSAAYGAISAVVRGTANNVHCSNVVMEGDITSLYDGTPWNDANGAVDLGFDTQKCHFQIKHRGTASVSAISAGISRATLISNTTFDLNCDAVTTNLVTNTQARLNTTAYVELYSCQHNARVTGMVDKIGAVLISRYALVDNGLFVPIDFTPAISGSTTAGVGTYSIQTGTATRIGDRVFFSLYLTWSAHTGTGNMWITGLPASSSAVNTQSAVSVAFLNNIATTAGTVVMAHKDANNDRIIITQTPTGGGVLTAVPIDTAGAIMVSGHYPVD